MATNKTLSPTNVTISIPAMGDQPDASVFSNCIDKEADAINAIDSLIQTFIPTLQTRLANQLGAKVTIPNNGRHLFIFTGAGTGRFAMVLANTTSNGNTTIVEIYKGENVTLAASGNDLTYTIAGSTVTSVVVSDFALQGDLATVSTLS